MTTVGIYVDGPNMERGLFEAKEMAVLERVGSILVEHARGLGEITDARVFLDESTIWRSERTREDYEMNGFRFQETKSFKYVDARTGAFTFGKSLTDPSMHCAVIDRLHDADCPDVLIIVTGDKDITVALDYIHDHGRRAEVIGEANSLSGFLVSKCDALGYNCHVLQLMARGSKVMETAAPSEIKAAAPRCEGLRVTDGSGRPVSAHKYIVYRNDRSNQQNPNNIAYWRSRGFDERPPDWERRLKKEKKSKR